MNRELMFNLTLNIDLHTESNTVCYKYVPFYEDSAINSLISVTSIVGQNMQECFS